MSGTFFILHLHAIDYLLLWIFYFRFISLRKSTFPSKERRIFDIRGFNWTRDKNLSDPSTLLGTASPDCRGPLGLPMTLFIPVRLRSGQAVLIRGFISHPASKAFIHIPPFAFKCSGFSFVKGRIAHQDGKRKGIFIYDPFDVAQDKFTIFDGSTGLTTSFR